MKRYLIVGGVAGGATAAARLRRLSEDSEIIVFERGSHISFANCGMPYHIGGMIADREDLLLQTPGSFRARFNADVRVGCEVTSIDCAARTVAVRNLHTGETYVEKYDKLILSPGGEPIKPPVGGTDLSRVFTLRSMNDMDAIKKFITVNRPKKAAVIGGGFIGVEMAENLVSAGLEVEIVELSNQLIAPFDFDAVCEIHSHIRKNGVALRLNCGLKGITEKNGRLKLALTDGDMETDMVIMSVGVRPEDRLARDAGLAIGERGGIVTDDRMRTSDPDIYAVGDAALTSDYVTGLPVSAPLAGPANKQARVAADNICGIPSVYRGSLGSAVIKVFDMTAACTGINEKTAKRCLINYDKVFLWLPGHAGYYPGSLPMSMKVLFDPVSGRILGAQITGYKGVDKRCDVLAAAISAGMDARGLAGLELCYAPPYSSAKDPVNMAGFVIENALAGRVKNFHWHDVDALTRDGSAALLDVRNPQETKRGKIDGFVNIPLDSLRERILELDAAKPVYAHCHSGMRSYIAARILSQRGFTVYNLSGGYRLYESVKKEMQIIG